MESLIANFALTSLQSSVQFPAFMIGSYLIIKAIMKRAWSC